MSSISKSATIGSAARAPAAKRPGWRARRAATATVVCEETAQAPDERDNEIDCRRIVERDGSRSLPQHNDDCNRAHLGCTEREQCKIR